MDFLLPARSENSGIYMPDIKAVYLEFTAASTQQEVYEALTIYLSATSTKHVASIGQYLSGSNGDIHVIRYGVDNNIVFFNHANQAVLTCTMGSYTAIGAGLQICFIAPTA